MMEQVEITATQVGDMMLGGLRHAMLTSDAEMIDQIIRDVDDIDAVESVQILGYNHRVLNGRHGGESLDMNLKEMGNEECQICHGDHQQGPSFIWQYSGENRLLRLLTPIENMPDCRECHEPGISPLGVILIDVSMADNEAHALSELRIAIAASVVAMLIIVVVLYQLINRLVLRRVELIQHPLDSFSAGDFTARIPLSPTPSDELYQLGHAFNQMMDQIEDHIQEKEHLTELRSATIIEERNRIARELHDGLAQILTYINAKTTAARLMISKNQNQKAVNHLLQLEEASQDLYVEVREAILGLKTAGRVGQGLDQTLRYYASQFSQLSGIPVQVVTPETCRYSWNGEVEVQLLRIAQEALANTRKHAGASRAWIHLQITNDHLEMVVGDNGVGFNLAELPADNGLHFGLGSMKERASSIKAAFDLHSVKGDGTQVKVRMPLPEKEV